MGQGNYADVSQRTRDDAQRYCWPLIRLYSKANFEAGRGYADYPIGSYPQLSNSAQGAFQDRANSWKVIDGYNPPAEGDVQIPIGFADEAERTRKKYDRILWDWLQAHPDACEVIFYDYDRFNRGEFHDSWKWNALSKGDLGPASEEMASFKFNISWPTGTELTQLKMQQARAAAAQRASEAQARQEAANQALAAQQMTIASKELTLYNGGQSAFTASTSTESSSGANCPHPGTSLCDPGQWVDAAGPGVTPQSLGLPTYLLAWQPDGTIRPAAEEYKTLLAAAQNPANPAAQQYAYAVLSSLNLAPAGVTPAQVPAAGAGGGDLMAELAHLFG